MSDERLDDHVISLCEQSDLSLRQSLAVMAIFAGRADEASRLLGNQAAAMPLTHRLAEACQKQPVSAPPPWKPAPAAKKKAGRPKGCAQKNGDCTKRSERASRDGTVPAFPRRNTKLCTRCGEAKGFRAFAQGESVCNACATGEKAPKFKRAASLAEADAMDE